MTAPVTFDTVTFTDTTDFDRFAEEQLLGNAGTGWLPEDVTPLEWMLRAYEALGSSPYAERLAHGIASALTSSNPSVRFLAITFFEQHPTAPGGERIELLVSGDRSLFPRVAAPPFAQDLEFRLLRALGARAAARVSSAVAIAKQVVLEPGKAGGVIAGLGQADADWLFDHAEEIVRASPAVVGTLLYRVVAERLDVEAIVGRVAAAGVVPLPQLKNAVAESVMDLALRQRILSGLGRGPG